MNKLTVALCTALTAASSLCSEVRILPTPHYLEQRGESLTIPKGGVVSISIGQPGDTMQLAADLIADGFRRASVDVHMGRNGAGAATIELWSWAGSGKPPVSLNALDRQVLLDSAHWGQSYVIRPGDDHTLYLVGSSPQGVLMAATTLLQAIGISAAGVEIPRVYIRDFPDFQYRAAADWLLNGEVNRWSLDRGQGPEAFRGVAKQKIDQALRFKINMIFADGFGWGLRARFEGYPALMRDLNQYARRRGIQLAFGGYGASYGITYQTGPIYEEGGYLGEIFRNRTEYPDGPVYQCMGFTRGKKGVDASVLGSCRSNEELNRLKGDELRRFVQAVEPGALYIHHEDFGNYRGTESMWQKRCDRCRKRWPNDSLLAPDGGAGGLANGYAALVRAVNSVKNADSGYDAARDCQIVLISPVYHPDSPASEDWVNTLELWRNVGQKLPPAANLQIGFRETFPQKFGGRRWTEEFNATMQTAGLPYGMFLYFAGGADDWVTDYPLSGVPAMNELFAGARTIYNDTGDFYREPMQLIAAEYSWNRRSAGFYADPEANDPAVDLWRKYVFQPNTPDELFGSGKLFEFACERLYGREAGGIMARYYRRSELLPDTPLTENDRVFDKGYLPMSWNRAYGIPSHWRALAVDSKTWSAEITNERYADVYRGMHIDRAELHRRLARRWGIGAELNRKATTDVAAALAAHPSDTSLDDLRFMGSSLRVYQGVMEALESYHDGLRAWFAKPRDPAVAAKRFSSALARATEASEAVAREFPNPVDPIGGDVGAIRRYTGILCQSIRNMQKEL
jgi:hypothetical protein